MIIKKYFALFIALFVGFISSAHANEGKPLSLDLSADKPLWEMGLFNAAFYGPIYPAAEDYQSKVLPVPFVIYRGKVFRLGDDSIVKAVAVEQERFKLDLSLGGAFNADSEDARIRQGMPDLDFMFEVGPEASFLMTEFSTLPEGFDDNGELWLNLQLRAAFSTDFDSITQRGYVFQPELAFTLDDALVEDSRFFFSIAPTFSSDKNQQYFYDVGQAYVLPNRPYYKSHGGYLGTKVSVAHRVQINKSMMLFGAVQLGFWQQGQNIDSPLYREEFTYSLALGLKWTLFSSKQTVGL
ncbi:MipA/OmpV family protein [Thalassotalea ponticola]|uniref:MipA/OmpV family protein n=1 Tax=Thalassotalea ponticola TaxID=1523392 RepID=UPI0025B2BB59|nr:MipA/OmpV family protein [Thalassotalea ponticola]MDN3651798.1 MipA/OmpV family protein [Thalassotalea ponticola]